MYVDFYNDTSIAHDITTSARKQLLSGEYTIPGIEFIPYNEKYYDDNYIIIFIVDGYKDKHTHEKFTQYLVEKYVNKVGIIFLTKTSSSFGDIKNLPGDHPLTKTKVVDILYNTVSPYTFKHRYSNTTSFVQLIRFMNINV